MSSQPEFPAIVAAKEELKERERLLQEVEFPRKRNRTLLAALLRVVASYPPGKCFLSQETLGKMFKVSPRTIQRAFAYLAELNLIAFGPTNRRIGSNYITLNTYSVNWPSLKQRVTAQSMPSDATVTSKSNALAIRQLEGTDATFEADRSDTYAKAMRHLEGTVTTLSCPPISDSRDFIKTSTTELQQQECEALLDAKPVALRAESQNFDRIVDAYNAEDVYGAAELLGKVFPRVGGEYLEHLLAFYKRNPGAWGAGALRNRVKHSQPGLDPEKGWPPRAIEAPVGPTVPRSRPTPAELAAKSAEFERDRQAARESGGLSDEERAALRAAGLVRKTRGIA
jgi:hypothetical protein